MKRYLGISVSHSYAQADTVETWGARRLSVLHVGSDFSKMGHRLNTFIGEISVRMDRYKR